MAKPAMRIVIAGHVDHGKSTLIGRLLYDTGRVPEDRYEQIKKICESQHKPFELAFLMDAFEEEQRQGVTIDTTRIFFETDMRRYVIIDAPGHREFLKNMLTGASSAEAALLLIDAAEGVQEQFRRHAYLLKMLGIEDVVVVVNKMDLVGYGEKTFSEVTAACTQVLKTLGLAARTYVPASAREGDGVVAGGTRMPWYDGRTVIQVLDSLRGYGTAGEGPLRFPVQDVYKFDERRIVAGRIESGTLRVGDRLVFSPGGTTASVKRIERWKAPEPPQAAAGESIGVVLAEDCFIERGLVAALPEDAPKVGDRFSANVFWMSENRLEAGVKYRIKLTTQDVEADVLSVDRVIDSGTLEPVQRTKRFVARHEAAQVTFRTKSPVAFDVFGKVRATGRFVIVDGREVAGGGIITVAAYPDRRAYGAGAASGNISLHRPRVTRAAREERTGHGGVVVWLTGLPGSGKTSTAIELEKRLFEEGQRVYWLDGENVRHGLSADLGFSPDDRAENIRRAGEAARLFLDAGFIVITSFIAPYRADRAHVRSRVGDGDFVEVFLDCPLGECEKRDPRYARARLGEIRDFTGVGAPYERPENPELVIDTGTLDSAESADVILEYLRERL